MRRRAQQATCVAAWGEWTNSGPPNSTSTYYILLLLDLARHLRRLRHPLSTCHLASRWKQYMAFLRSFYVADDIWLFA